MELDGVIDETKQAIYEKSLRKNNSKRGCILIRDLQLRPFEYLDNGLCNLEAESELIAL